MECLLDGIGNGMATSWLENSGSSMSWDSKGKEVTDDGSSENVAMCENGCGTPRRSNTDQMATASVPGSVGVVRGGGGGVAGKDGDSVQVGVGGA